MILYHGTSARHLSAIKQDGIQPRGACKSLWKGAPSHPECVYLTNAYPLHFAQAATKRGDLAILEVDVTEECLLPDEDWLEQVTRTGGPAPNNISMKQRTAWYRKRLFSFGAYAEQSLQGIGNVAHRGTIPPSKIKRVLTINQKAATRLILYGQDPRINVLNYRFCGANYRMWVAWMFGDSEPPSPSPGRDGMIVKNFHDL